MMGVCGSPLLIALFSVKSTKRRVPVVPMSFRRRTQADANLGQGVCIVCTGKISALTSWQYGPSYFSEDTIRARLRVNV